ncbi:MAG: penicillin-insensitive murein endopeptidase [Deltaproteobacteria bacterium]|nr:penicillin-insensitive murein endopeptidase [Deltaproteobacteria bacterium]
MRDSLVLLAVMIVALSGLTAAARAEGPEPLTPKAARALLAMPKGSVSLGKTSDGSLHAAVELPPKGLGYQVLGHALGRKTNYGTRELIDVIARATTTVAERFPGSKLGVGNLGFESGTKIPWSVSHQAGRDADLGMYATDDAGRPVELVPFVYYGPDLTARSNGRVVRFDLPRNLAFVTTLLADDEARVQYIFVAAWLKDRLIQEARRTGVSAEIIRRMQEVLHQPTDSNPHADHFHLRLFCSKEDRLHGCLNRQPPRDWVDLGDEEHRARSLELARILELSDDKLRVAALDKLAAIRGTPAMDAVVGQLEQGSTRVRKAALATLVTWADPTAAERITALLPRVRDARWASELFGAIPRLDADTLVPLAVRVARAPDAMLHPDVKKNAGVDLQVAAISILKEHGGAGEVDLLLELAGSRTKVIAKAATEALAWITCQPPKTRFEAWWREHARSDVVAWTRVGLAARGTKRLPASLRSRAGVELLIPLVASRDGALRHCAGRALVEITGHPFEARLRSPARNRKHWTSWWADNRTTSGLP